MLSIATPIQSFRATFGSAIDPSDFSQKFSQRNFQNIKGDVKITAPELVVRTLRTNLRRLESVKSGFNHFLDTKSRLAGDEIGNLNRAGESDGQHNKPTKNSQREWACKGSFLGVILLGDGDWWSGGQNRCHNQATYQAREPQNTDSEARELAL
jgi:hypothetical protein